MHHVHPAWTNVLSTLNQGGVALIPTDTLYGIVARATNAQAVERIFAIKHRQPTKPLIVLIHDITDLETFGVTPTHAQALTLSTLWPGPVSVILPTQRTDLSYLDRGTHTIAFRFPSDPMLQSLLAATGPLVAPSANREGVAPVSSTTEAQATFGTEIDCYADAPTCLSGKASRLVRMEEDGSITDLR